jgi:undecaprenyl-diphosphatase
MPRRNKSQTHRPDPSGRRRTPKRHILLWDRVWLRRWQRLKPPAWLDRILVVFVKLGDGWGWIPVAAGLAAILPAQRFLAIAGQGLLAAAVSVPSYRLLKASFRRTRPYALFKRVAARIPPRDAYSFPSGHTMNNLAIAASIAWHLPWLWPLALAIPLSIGLLRVMFGVHFVSDIAAGAVFGLIAAAGAVALYPALTLP